LRKGWTKKQPFEKRLDQKTTFWEKVEPKNNLLRKGWTKKQPFEKRLDQKTTFWEKVGPKNNLLRKGWTKKQPFEKRLDQKTTFWEKVEPKSNLLRKGWTKKQPFEKRLDQKTMHPPVLLMSGFMKNYSFTHASAYPFCHTFPKSVFLHLFSFETPILYYIKKYIKPKRYNTYIYNNGILCCF